MRKNYDFSTAKRNPYAKRLKKQGMINGRTLKGFHRATRVVQPF